MSFKDLANKELAAAQGVPVQKSPEKKANDGLPKDQPAAEGESIKVSTEPKS